MYKNKSILDNIWIIKSIDERKILYISQKYNYSNFLSKLLASLDIHVDEIDEFLSPDITKDIPNPFRLKDMKKTISRTIEAIKNNEKIGILGDYDVDGSTSVAILFNFFKFFNVNVSIKIPNKLTEGYGPNERIMDEFLEEKVSIVYSMDCGTTSFPTLNNKKYSVIDIIIIDHHISEARFPNIYSLINPNRYDENSEFKNLAAVGVTFLFLMALRKTLRIHNFFKFKKEPNLLSFLDFVALGTVCDVVPLEKINRTFVFKGLEIIRSRQSKAIATILDNSNLKSEPKANDLGYILGPQINAASRIGDSTLPTKILVSKDINEIDSISRKLILLNEKRKLIENKIYNEALNQINNTKSLKFILINGENWHSGVLGIVASRLLKKYYKPTIVISFDNKIGVGSARSINSINLGNIILEAKNEGLLISGGGHSKAAGFKIEKDRLNSFSLYLDNVLKHYDDELFEKKVFYTEKLSLNQIQLSLLDDLQKLEPFGNGNEEPNFIFTDIKIESVMTIKGKHNLVFFKNDFDKIIKGICFNSVNTIIGDYLENYRQFNFEIAGSLKVDNYKNNSMPQIIIKDLMLLKL